MPIFGKKHFEMSMLPEDLAPDTELWYSEVTGEGFLTYNDYFAKQLLYSSLSWTCSITGKSGLTFNDALRSENETEKLYESLPRILQKVLLYLMKFQNSFSISVILACLAKFTNGRYFIGENVQVYIESNPSKNNAVITDVVPPKIKKPYMVAYGLDPLLYGYVVEFSDGSQEPLPAGHIARPKNLLTKEKIRLFLKQHLAPKKGRYDNLTVKDESLIEFGVDQLEWEDIFKGPLPDFKDDTVVVKTKYQNHRHEESSSVLGEENLSDSSVQISKKKNNILMAKKKKLIIRERKFNKDKKKKQIVKVRGKPGPKKKIVNNQEKSKESKIKKEATKNREKAIRKQFEEDFKAWHEKRDDLLCDDLKQLPVSKEIRHKIHDSLIGDSLKIIDFLNVYRIYIPFEATFPSSISLSHFSNLLHDNHLPRDGCVDVFVALLRAILNSKECSIDFDEPDEIEKMDPNDFADHDETIEPAADNEQQPNMPVIRANQYIVKYFSTKEQLAKFDLNYITLQEILRIYIYKTRFHGTTNMKITPEEMAVVEKLTSSNLCDLSPKERILIFNILLNDLINVPPFKEKIDDSMEKMFRLKSEIRHLKAETAKWLRDNPTRQRIRKRKSDDSDDTNTVEPDDEVTKEEKDQFKREKMEKLEKMAKVVGQLKTKIRKYSAFCRPRPLGMDRYHRKYWIFQSIPGLFVEDTIADGHTYPCFEDPKPMTKPQLSDNLSNTRRPKDRLPVRNILVNSSKSEDDDVIKRCTGNPSTCTVHACEARSYDPPIRWSFYRKEQIPSLIDALNSRGTRECELKNAIIMEKKAIIEDHYRKFNSWELQSRTHPFMRPQEESIFVVRKSGRLRSKGNNRTGHEKSTDHSHDYNCKEKLYVTEQNIYLGGFSSRDEETRILWCVGVYDSPYCGDRVKSLSFLVEKMNVLVRTLKPFCLTAPLGVRSVSSTSSPSEKEDQDNSPSLNGNKIVISEQWLDGLRVPESLKTNNTIDFDDPVSSYGITHHSQFYLNVFLLRKSIKWNLSAQITCTICDACKEKATKTNMLLCDQCNCGYHYACVRPPVKPGKQVIGDWFCYTCVPRLVDGPRNECDVNEHRNHDYDENQMDEKEVISNNKENIKKNEEGSLLDRCFTCKKRIIESFSEVCCKTCCEYFHLACVNLTRVPRSWSCFACTKKEMYDMRHKNREMNIIKNNKNYDSDLRRSSRKRKPNYYKYETDEENYSPSFMKKRSRYSDFDDDDDVIVIDDDEEEEDFDKPNRNRYNSRADSDEEYGCRILS